MAQLDKLLTYILPKGAEALRLEANKPPMLHMPSGVQSPLVANPVPSTMLDLLARELVPAEANHTWQATGEVEFDYYLGEQVFHLQLGRTPLGSFIQATPILKASPQPEPLPVIPEPQATRASLPLPQAPEAQVPEKAQPAVEALPPQPGRHPLADRLFTTLLASQGSDLHCTSFEMPIVRVHGDLEELLDFGLLGPNQLLEMMEALAPPAAWAHFQEKRDADFAYPFEAGNCRFRVNYFMDRLGPGMVCRLIPNQIPDPDQLGLPNAIRDLADLSKGLVLVTGPTGSGKSTTLAAIIDLINRRRRDHILTIEDPIEFVHPRRNCLVNQREVGTHTASFKSGLRAALREDPDVVMVGEMRDLETISIALETAITGHLVFGTLHTSSAIGTIDRIIDQFPADRQAQVRVMLADSLKACISQSLLKRRSGGRVAAIESLFITPAIASLIRDGKAFQIVSAMQTGRAYGQKLMNDALVELIEARQIDPQEGYMKCPDKETYMAALKRHGIDWDPRGDQ
nr:PilT/PilU family type 4a pilus ATPase [uncultured Holophaga sp.]